jgi:hypothetical protein
MDVDADFWNAKDLLDILFSEEALREYAAYLDARSGNYLDIDAWVRQASDVRRSLKITEAQVNKLLDRIGDKVYRCHVANHTRLFLAQKLIPALVWAACNPPGNRSGVQDLAERGGEKVLMQARVPVDLVPEGLSATEAILEGLKLLKAARSKAGAADRLRSLVPGRKLPSK